MDYPIFSKNGYNQTIATALKIGAVLAAIWLLNVLFVAVHEGGHAAVAAAYGSRIYDVYISPTGMEGSTTHTQLNDRAQADLVLAAGVIASTLAVIVSCLIRLEIAVYVLGLRTAESLLNYTSGSDMCCLLGNVGSNAYLISIGLMVITGLFVGLTVRKRLNKSRSDMRMADLAKLSSASPTPTA